MLNSCCSSRHHHVDRQRYRKFRQFQRGPSGRAHRRAAGVTVAAPREHRGPATTAFARIVVRRRRRHHDSAAVAVVRVHPGASGLRVRGAPAVRQHRAPGPVPVVVAQLRQAAQARERAQGEGDRRVPPRQLQGTVPAAGEQSVLRAQPSQVASALAKSPLRGGREVARSSVGRRWQVSGAPQVPAAADHMGR